MTTVAEIFRQIDARIPLAKAGGWDPVGLQVGDRTAPVTSIAVCHEATDDVVEALEVDPVDLLVTYHPLLFRPSQEFVAGTSASGRAFRLARSGTAVAAVHTAFDVTPGGVADALADALVLQRVEQFGPNWGVEGAKIVTFAPDDHAESVVAAMASAGAGRVGRYTSCSYRASGFGGFTPGSGADPAVGTVGMANLEPETRLEMIAAANNVDRVVAALVSAHPYEEPAYDVYPTRSNAGFVGRVGSLEPTTLGALCERTASTLGCTPRVAGDRAGRVERVAVVPGSGGSFLIAAAGLADVVVTGDVSHHQARDAVDRGLAVIDVGHVPGERPGVERLYALLAQLGVPIRNLIELDPDPWS